MRGAHDGRRPAALERAQIPAGPVQSPAQALDDPHIRATGMLRPVDYPGLPVPAPVTDTPVRLGRAAADGLLRAPLLGEHTDDILRELGYDAAAIGGLRAGCVV